MSKITEALAIATLKILTPLVRTLLRHGVAHGTFAEWSKKAYVDGAIDELQREGKKATITNISAITGLTRKESKRLNEICSSDNALLDARYNRSVRVLSGWQEDSEFSDNAGPSAKPKVLSLDSDQKPSFGDLVKRYSGDMTPVAMLDILSSAGCIAVEGATATLINTAYIPGGASASAEKINIFGTDVSELIDSISHNLHASQEQLKFQRKVSNTALAGEHVEDFKALVAQKSQAQLEELHHWLVLHEVPDDEPPEVRRHYVGVGIYYSDYQENAKDEC